METRINKLLNYARGIITNPVKTFQDITADKQISFYAFLFLCFLLILGFLPRTIVPQRISSVSPVALSLKLYLDFINATPLGPLVFSLLNTSIIHIISRMFSRNGKFVQLLGSFALIGVFQFILTYGFNIILNGVPQLKVISIALSVWFLYLEVIVITSVYKTTRKQAVLTLILGLAVLVMLFLLSMGLFAWVDLGLLHLSG